MTLYSHIALGITIGHLTGDYTGGVLASTLIDIDHIYSYAKHGVLWKPKQLYTAITSPIDIWGDQRGPLHAVYIAFPVIGLFWYFHFPALAIGYLGHLILDVLDGSDYWPLYPNKSINFRGPIPYNSKQELIFSVIIFIVLNGVIFLLK